jgi:hypothetical protein
MTLHFIVISDVKTATSFILFCSNIFVFYFRAREALLSTQTSNHSLSSWIRISIQWEHSVIVCLTYICYFPFLSVLLLYRTDDTYDIHIYLSFLHLVFSKRLMCSGIFPIILGSFLVHLVFSLTRSLCMWRSFGK